MLEKLLWSYAEVLKPKVWTFFLKEVLAVTYVLVQAAVLVLDETQTSFKCFFQKRKIVLSVP